MSSGRENLYTNHQGKTVFGGRVMRTPTTDHARGTDDSETDVIMQSDAPIDSVVIDIIREVAEMRKHGVLRPFVEGEPIGVLPRLVRKRPVTDKQSRAFNNMLMEERRAQMLKLRKRNNEDMRRLTQ